MKNIKQILAVVVLSVLIGQGINVFTKPTTDLNGIETAAGGNLLDEILERGTLRCAYIPYPPFFELDPNTGEKKGLTADLVREIGKRLNIKIEWTEEVGWGNFAEGFKNNRYDAVCAAVWQNGERSLHAAFSKPYGFSTVDVWARADDERFDNGNLARVNSEDIVISGMDGEGTLKLAAEHFPKAKITALPQMTPFTNMIMNVVNGKADIVIIEPETAEEFIKANPGVLKKVSVNKPLAAYPITMPLPRGEVELKAAIDNAIDEIFYTSKMDALLSANDITKDDLYLPEKPF